MCECMVYVVCYFCTNVLCVISVMCAMCIHVLCGSVQCVLHTCMPVRMYVCTCPLLIVMAQTEALFAEYALFN